MGCRDSRALVLAAAVATAFALLGGCRQGANRTAVIRCTPGERVDVSCGCLSLGEACVGDPGIRLCDAALANGDCDDAQAVTSTTSSDFCNGTCPLATTFCPASGMLAISTFALPDYSGETAAYSCAWGARRTPVHSGARAAFACMPGERIQASCGCEGLGRTCEGDPLMRACSPGMACTDGPSSLATDDDTCGRCPWLEAVCPAEGTIVIQTQAYSGGRYRGHFGVIGDDGAPRVPPVAVAAARSPAPRAERAAAEVLGVPEPVPPVAQ